VGGVRPEAWTVRLHFTPDRAPAVLAHLDDWRGRPLESHEVIVNTIAATTTRSGLTVHAELDTRPKFRLADSYGQCNIR
jgi:hypothetical protein